MIEFLGDFDRIKHMDNNIRNIRKSRGLTTSKLADMVKPATTNVTITRLETGQVPLTDEWMLKLSVALNCEPWELLPNSWQPQTKSIDDQSRWKRILRSVNTVLIELGKDVPEDIKIDFVFYLYDNGFCRQFDHVANDNEVRPVVTENFLKSKVA